MLASSAVVLSPGPASPPSSSPSSSPGSLRTVLTYGHALLTGDKDIHTLLQDLAAKHGPRKEKKRKRSKKEKKEKKEKPSRSSDKSATWGASSAKALPKASAASALSSSASASALSSSGPMTPRTKFSGSSSLPASSSKPRRKRSVSGESHMSTSAEDHALPHRDRSHSSDGFFSSGEMVLPATPRGNRDVILRSHSASSASLTRDPPMPSGKPQKTNGGSLTVGSRIACSGPVGTIGSRSQSSPSLGQPHSSGSSTPTRHTLGCLNSKPIAKKSSTSPRAQRTRSTSFGSALPLSPHKPGPAPVPPLHLPSSSENAHRMDPTHHSPHQHHHSAGCRHHPQFASGPRSSLMIPSNEIACRHARSAPPSYERSPAHSARGFVPQPVPITDQELFMILSSVETDEQKPALSGSMMPIPNMFLAPVADARSTSTSPVMATSNAQVERRDSIDMMSVTDTMQRVSLAKDDFDPLSVLDLDDMVPAEEPEARPISVLPTPPLEFQATPQPPLAIQPHQGIPPFGQTSIVGTFTGLLARNDEQHMRDLMLAFDAMPCTTDTCQYDTRN